MKQLFKIFTILPSDQYKMCIFIVCAMIVGAMLEAVGIGAIFPLISIMGNKNFLLDHQELAEHMTVLGITCHTEFIILASVALIGVYIVKNIYIAWENNLQISFSVKNQIYYSKELLGEYLSKPYLFHVNQNTATLIKNVNIGVGGVKRIED